MEIRYTGPLRKVVFETAPGNWVSCERGGTVDVDEDVAAGLLDQVDIWQLAAPLELPKRPGKKAPKDEWIAYVDAINADGDGVAATENHTVAELIALADAREQQLAQLVPDDEESTGSNDTDDQEV